MTDGEARPIDAPQATESVIDGLLRIAGAARFFRSADGQFHARVPLKNRHAILGLKSADFRDWLIESFRSDRGELPTRFGCSPCALGD